MIMHRGKAATRFSPAVIEGTVEICFGRRIADCCLNIVIWKKVNRHLRVHFNVKRGLFSMFFLNLPGQISQFSIRTVKPGIPDPSVENQICYKFEI